MTAIFPAGTGACACTRATPAHIKINSSKKLFLIVSTVIKSNAETGTVADLRIPSEMHALRSRLLWRRQGRGRRILAVIVGNECFGDIHCIVQRENALNFRYIEDQINSARFGE